MFQKSESNTVSEPFPEYQELVGNISDLPEKTINTEYIESETGHTLIFGNSLDDSETKYPQLISISRISFNKKMNKAAVYAGRSTQGSGFTNLYLFEKINGKWKIIFKKNISVA